MDKTAYSACAAETYIGFCESPLGRIILASDGEQLTGLWFEGQKYERAGIKASNTAERSLPVFDLTKKWLEIYFGGSEPDFTPPLKLTGSAFRRTVSQIMLEIPYGSTAAYGELAAEAAKRLGKDRMSARAVGNAVGHNPISLIVPCHRVVGKDGSLTGYAGGTDRKRFLLETEAASKRCANKEEQQERK